MTFCTFLKNGLMYNNDTTAFTVAPCCHFAKTYQLAADQATAEQLDTLRKEWLTADVEKLCRVCINMENAGLPSYRQASFDLATGADNRIEALTVAVNKQCNLACATCGPDQSSFWYQENIRNNQPQSSYVINLHQEERSGATADRFIKTLAEQDLSAVKFIKFGGGEPLMSDVHYRILETIINPEQVVVQYTSNFSIMPTARVMDMWKRFKLVKWIASLDGVGTQFEIIRWPYKWAKLNEFVTQAIDCVPDNVMFGVEHTVNALNAYYYPEFEEWFNHRLSVNKSGDKSDLNLHACHGVMSLLNMPPELRELTKNRLGPDHPVTAMIDQRPYTGYAQDLVAHMDDLDSVRNTRWRQEFALIQGCF